MFADFKRVAKILENRYENKNDQKLEKNNRI